MLPYQSYYQPTAPAPIYSNNYQPYQPYLQYQPPQNAGNQQGYPLTGTNQMHPQPKEIVGRLVSDFSEIVANDVPMDGRNAIFPKNDFSEIQVRAWGADGKIQTTSYKPVFDDFNNNVENTSNSSEKLKLGLSDEATEAFMKRFDDIAGRLNELEFWAKSLNNLQQTTINNIDRNGSDSV